MSLKPCVTMADALGWGTDELIGFPRRNDRDDGLEYRARDLRAGDEPAFALTEKVRSWKRIGLRASVSDAGYRKARPRTGDEPAVTVTSKHRSAEWTDGVRVTVDEASALQGFRADYPWHGSRTKQFAQIGNAVCPPVARAVLAEAMRASLDDDERPWVEIRRGHERITEGFDPTTAPAQAVTTRVNRWQARGITRGTPESGSTTKAPKGDEALLPYVTMAMALGWQDERQFRATNDRPNVALRDMDQPAPTLAFGHNPPRWVFERPATTVACDPRVHPPGHKENASDPPGRYEQRRGANAIRVTIEEAAVLQSFRPGYPWQGTVTKQFQQVGNAVPPLLARAVLEAAMSPQRVARPRRQVAKPTQLELFA